MPMPRCRCARRQWRPRAGAWKSTWRNAAPRSPNNRRSKPCRQRNWPRSRSTRPTANWRPHRRVLRWNGGFRPPRSIVSRRCRLRNRTVRLPFRQRARRKAGPRPAAAAARAEAVKAAAAVETAKAMAEAERRRELALLTAQAEAEAAAARAAIAAESAKATAKDKATPGARRPKPKKRRGWPRRKPIAPALTRRSAVRTRQLRWRWKKRAWKPCRKSSARW